MIPPTLPSIEELAPFLRRLELSPDGIVLIAITFNPDAQNYAEARWSFFTAEQRRRFKRALSSEKRRQVSSPSKGKKTISRAISGTARAIHKIDD